MGGVRAPPLSVRYDHPGDLAYIQTFWQQQVDWVRANWPHKPFAISETGAGGVFEWTNSSDPRWSQGYEAEVVQRDAQFAVSNVNVSGQRPPWHRSQGFVRASHRVYAPPQASPCGSSMTSKPTTGTPPSVANVTTCHTLAAWQSRGPAATSMWTALDLAARTTKDR